MLIDISVMSLLWEELCFLTRPIIKAQPCDPDSLTMRERYLLRARTGTEPGNVQWLQSFSPSLQRTFAGDTCASPFFFYLSDGLSHFITVLVYRGFSETPTKDHSLVITTPPVHESLPVCGMPSSLGSPNPNGISTELHSVLTQLVAPLGNTPLSAVKSSVSRRYFELQRWCLWWFIMFRE